MSIPESLVLSVALGELHAPAPAHHLCFTDVTAMKDNTHIMAISQKSEMTLGPPRALHRLLSPERTQGSNLALLSRL